MSKILAGVAPTLLLATLLAGCAHSSSSAQRAPQHLAVHTDTKIGSTDGDQDALQGELQALKTDARVCYFVDGPHGRAFIVTRSGSYAGEDLMLHANGSSPARPGHTYLFLGAPGWETHLSGCPGVGRPWYTGDISTAQPSYANATLGPVKTRVP